MKMPDHLYQAAKAAAFVSNKKTVASGSRPLYITFAIRFRYLQQFHQLRVMKIIRNYDSPIYKIVLSSALKTNGWICWLKRQSKSWHLILGNGIDEKLIAAISSAIGSMNKA
jgi:hypothetical protein